MKKIKSFLFIFSIIFAVIGISGSIYTYCINALNILLFFLICQCVSIIFSWSFVILQNWSNGYFKKKIIFFGEECYLYCDGKCHKAWGLPSRPRVKVDGKEYWIADDEFDVAPDDPGTYEGCDGKPMIRSGRDMNKWCARCCERSKIVNVGDTLSDLPNWDTRKEIEV